MATIRDVARVAGVSTATVSNVLHGRSERVGSETRVKVLDAVRSLKYRPTPLEQNQRAILTQNLGVMVTDLTAGPLAQHGYFRNVLDGVLESAAMRGWSVTIFVERMWYDVGMAVRRSYDGRCDGLVYVAPQPGNEVVEALRERGTPLVLVGSTPWLSDISSVDIDNFALAESAARYLIELGHRRLAYAGHVNERISSVERRESFMLTAHHLGVPETDLHWLTNGRPDEGSDAEQICRQIVCLDPRPTGILCWHDGLASQIVAAAPRFGLRIPEDLSIIGVDDAPESRESIPMLTTFRNPLDVLGKRAATMLIDRLTTGRSVTENIRFVADLVVRESTAPAPEGEGFEYARPRL